MDVKDILLQIDGGAANRARLDLAIALARQHEAHLTGLCVVDIVVMAEIGVGTLSVDDSTGVLELQERVRERAIQAAGELEQEFRERLRVEGVPGEWRLVEGRAPALVSLHARYADLAILGQDDPGDPQGNNWMAALQGALLGSGRPILVVPYAGRFNSIGRRVLVGWDAGREAARAVHDALPFIAGADTITIVAVDPKHGNSGHGDEPAADLARHLARHGLQVTAMQATSGGLDPADVLLNYAADQGSDLIVIGGYGHSRARELVLGGVTRSMLRHATVPVLMSH